MHVKVRVMSFMSGVICSSRLISKTFWKRCCVRTIRRWDMVFQTTSAVQWLKMLHLLQSLRRRGRQVHRRAEGSRLACSRRLLIFGGTVGQEDQPAQCNGGLKCFLCVSIPIMSISEAPAIWCHLMQFVYLLSLLWSCCNSAAITSSRSSFRIRQMQWHFVRVASSERPMVRASCMVVMSEVKGSWMFLILVSLNFLGLRCFFCRCVSRCLRYRLLNSWYFLRGSESMEPHDLAGVDASSVLGARGGYGYDDPTGSVAQQKHSCRNDRIAIGGFNDES